MAEYKRINLIGDHSYPPIAKAHVGARAVRRPKDAVTPSGAIRYWTIDRPTSNVHIHARQQTLVVPNIVSCVVIWGINLLLTYEKSV